MRYRSKKKSCLLYPEDQAKVYWDVFITLVLLLSCVTTPLGIAFSEGDDNIANIIRGYFIDISFCLDIFVIFFSAYYDDEFQIIENRKEIAIEYFYTWFALDFFAVVPFEKILQSGGQVQNLDGLSEE